jgi:hypothetical protein
MTMKARRAPHAPVLSDETAPTTGPSAYQSSNSALISQQDAGQKPGPIGRLFDRITGESDEGASMSTLRKYLDTELDLCEGEFFRGWKLDGSSESLMEMLDANEDKEVTADEFSAFRGPVLGAIAPGLSEDATDDEVLQAALASFGAIDGPDGDGSLTLQEIQSATKAMLPKDTEHPDVVSQLGARVAIDVIDTDQPDEKVAERELSQEEWTQAALAMQMRRREQP